MAGSNACESVPCAPHPVATTLAVTRACVCCARGRSVVPSLRPVLDLCMDKAFRVLPNLHTRLNTWGVVGKSGSGKTEAATSLIGELAGVMAWDWALFVGPRGTYTSNARTRELFAVEQVRAAPAIALCFCFFAGSALAAPSRWHVPLTPSVARHAQCVYIDQHGINLAATAERIRLTIEDNAANGYTSLVRTCGRGHVCVCALKSCAPCLTPAAVALAQVVIDDCLVHVLDGRFPGVWSFAPAPPCSAPVRLVRRALTLTPSPCCCTAHAPPTQCLTCS